MNRSPRLASLLLLLLLPAATGLVLLAVHLADSHDPATTPSPEVSGPHDLGPRDLQGEEAGARLHDARVPEKSLREVLKPSAETLLEHPERDVRSTRSCGLVRVHGHVRRDGHAAPDFDISFHAMGGGPDTSEEDWDFTDEAGRYEVELPAGCYVVLNDDGGPWVANAVVAEGVDELLLDIDLPPGLVRSDTR
ncbi:MAG: hypothetical protein AB1486_26140 [Planctomycetota bacterium]